MIRTFSSVNKHARLKPIMLVSEYGELLNVRPMTKLKPADGKQDLREVIMVDDNTDTKTLV